MNAHVCQDHRHNLSCPVSRLKLSRGAWVLPQDIDELVKEGKDLLKDVSFNIFAGEFAMSARIWLSDNPRI